MGKDKYLKEIENLFERSPVVSYSSIIRLMKSKNKVKYYPKRIINYLISKEKIKRLAKGYYTKSNDASLSVYCFQPDYLGLQDALSHHNIWEQETVPIIITTRKVRQGIRSILGKNVFLRRIQKKYFFGIEYALQDGLAMPYSDIEKTFLDMIYFKEKLGEEVLSEFRNRLDIKKLKGYLKRYPKRIKSIVENYIEKGSKRGLK